MSIPNTAGLAGPGGERWGVDSSTGAFGPQYDNDKPIGSASARPSNVVAVKQTVAGAHGESCVFASISEEITLSLVGATTDSTLDLLPANSFILGVAWYWTVAGVTLTNFAFGDATTAARFHAADTVFTLGASGVDQSVGNPANTNAAGPLQVAAAKLRITQTGSQATAGKVRVTVFYRQLIAPTS